MVLHCSLMFLKTNQPSFGIQVPSVVVPLTEFWQLKFVMKTSTSVNHFAAEEEVLIIKDL